MREMRTESHIWEDGKPSERKRLRSTGGWARGLSDGRHNSVLADLGGNARSAGLLVREAQRGRESEMVKCSRTGSPARSARAILVYLSSRFFRDVRISASRDKQIGTIVRFLGAFGPMALGCPRICITPLPTESSAARPGYSSLCPKFPSDRPRSAPPLPWSQRFS